MFLTYQRDIPKRLAISEIVSGFLGSIHFAIFLMWDFRSWWGCRCFGSFHGVFFHPWASIFFSLRKRSTVDKLTVFPDFCRFSNSFLFDVKSGNNASTRDLVSGSVLGDILKQKVFEVPHGQSQLMANHADQSWSELFRVRKIPNIPNEPEQIRVREFVRNLFFVRSSFGTGRFGRSENPESRIPKRFIGGSS